MVCICLVSTFTSTFFSTERFQLETWVGSIIPGWKAGSGLGSRVGCVNLSRIGTTIPGGIVGPRLGPRVQCVHHA